MYIFIFNQDCNDLSVRILYNSCAPSYQKDLSPMFSLQAWNGLENVEIKLFEMFWDVVKTDFKQRLGVLEPMSGAKPR